MQSLHLKLYAMSVASLITLCFLALSVVVVLWSVLAYNGMIKKRNFVEDAWSSTQVLLKKRHNLVPNLVNTVKGYASHEASLLEKVTALRSPQSHNATDASQTEAKFGQSLNQLMLQVEAYPELKADTNFQSLQQQLASIETEIERSRRYYNASVRDYNTQLQSFPHNQIATHFNFAEAEYFELEDQAAASVPNVSF